MKNKIIAILISLIIAFSSICIYSGAEDIRLGDVNSDGKVNAIDARKVLRVSAQLETLTTEEAELADVNFDNKVNAIDARAILRASAQLETLPERPTQNTPTTDETTTEEPTTDETTTEEPTTDETTTEPEKETGTVVDEYPEAIDIFLSGKFYLDSRIDADNQNSLKIATKGKNYEFISELDGVEISIMFYNNKLHFKHVNAKGEKSYTVFDDEAIKQIESLTGEKFELNFDDILENFEFGEIKVNGSPVLTKGYYEGEECDIYTFGTDTGSIEFRFVDDDIKYISTFDEDGTESTVIHVNELSSKIPSTMLSTRGYTKKNILAFMTSIIPTA